MYKVFKNYYKIDDINDKKYLIEIVDCDLKCMRGFVYEGNYKEIDDKEVDVYCNDFNHKGYCTGDEIPLSYEELFDLINFLIRVDCNLSDYFLERKDELIDKLYMALLFYDDYVDYRFSKE